MKLQNRKIIIATRNRGKVAEFAAALAPLGVEVTSLLDYEGMPDIVEDGATFEDNAAIKARAIAGAFGLPVLADDSGLCVDALDGAPGVFSARYAGEGAADADNNAKLLRELGRAAGAASAAAGADGAVGGPARLSAAQFVCALALYDPEAGTTLHVSGSAPGFIIAAPRGEGGFGYDPLFYLPEYGRTMAELTMEEKNAISHRGQALRKLLSELGTEQA